MTAWNLAKVRPKNTTVRMPDTRKSVSSATKNPKYAATIVSEVSTRESLNTLLSHHEMKRPTKIPNTRTCNDLVFLETHTYTLFIDPLINTQRNAKVNGAMSSRIYRRDNMYSL